MKKTTAARRFLALVFIPLFILSCTGSSRIGKPGIAGEAGTIQFETLEENQVILLFPEQGGASPRMNIRLRLIDTERGAAQDKDLALLAQHLLYGGISPWQYVQDVFYTKVEDYLAQREGPDRGEALNWEYSEWVDQTEPYARFMILCQGREYYLGGAHGMREKQFYVVDYVNKEAVRLENLIRPEARPALRELLTDALRRRAGLQSGSPLSGGGFFEDAVEAPENFFLAPEGVGFHWNPYEIAPYVMGSIQVVLPWNEVRGLLAPSYQSL